MTYAMKLHIADGLQELGRDAPADVICPVPTVRSSGVNLPLMAVQHQILSLDGSQLCRETGAGVYKACHDSIR